jgi:hypothetical protein
MSETRNLCSGLRRFLDVAQRVLELVLLALEILRRLPLAEDAPITRPACPRSRTLERRTDIGKKEMSFISI